MTPTEQDKELRAYIAECFGMDKHEDWYDSYRYNDREKMLNYITADRERVALEARIDEMRLHRHEWALFGDRPPYNGESVSLPILLAYHDDRIAELKAQLEEL